MTSDAKLVYSLAGKRIWVAGERGMVGRAIVRRLHNEHCEILTVGRNQLDLRRQDKTEKWLLANRPQAIFLAAATVGGIYANATRPAEFIYDNLAIETNVIHGAHRAGVEKLLFLGSSCIYPKLANQPIREEELLTGPLEPTNEWYAIAKIAGIKLCQAYRRQYGADFISIQPTNLYGPFDNFDLSSSHVVPALITKAHLAREQDASTLSVWGSGSPRREFLYVDDLADAAVFLMQHYSEQEPINVGTGQEGTIRTLAQTIAEIIGFTGQLEFDVSKPDGTPRKLLDCGRLNGLGWHSPTSLHQGLAKTYAWYVAASAPTGRVK